ncbi:MAG TPA: hypothetical protein VKU85_07245 [bacterium]|nr:hypothetical protein [bacterium]
MDARERNQREWDDPSNWRGPFYFGERDTRVMVKKRGRNGRGWTFNLANTAGRLLFTTLIAVIVVALALAIAFGGKS